MDHAVPISCDILGEHRLGNLVPACHDCNSANGQKRYDEYLRTTPDLPDPVGRIATDETHTRNHNHAPIIDTLSPETTEQVQRALQDLREQIGAAAGDGDRGHQRLPAERSETLRRAEAHVNFRWFSR